MVLVTALGLIITVGQWLIARESASATIYDRMVTAILELDKVHLNNPEVRPFFYDDRPLDPNDKITPKVHAIAEMTVDTFEIVLTQIRLNQDRFRSGEQDRRWITESFQRSRVLRDTFDATSRWYGPDLLGLRQKAGN